LLSAKKVGDSLQTQGKETKIQKIEWHDFKFDK
jgi:hypothetical protein